MSVIVLIAIVGATWFWWPQISDLLAEPRPGAPQPGMDCVEVDWDEWGRPLYDCRPPHPEEPPIPALPEPEPPPWTPPLPSWSDGPDPP